MSMRVCHEPSGTMSSHMPAPACETATWRVSSRWRHVTCGVSASALRAALRASTHRVSAQRVHLRTLRPTQCSVVTALGRKWPTAATAAAKPTTGWLLAGGPDVADVSHAGGTRGEACP